MCFKSLLFISIYLACSFFIFIFVIQQPWAMYDSKSVSQNCFLSLTFLLSIIHIQAFCFLHTFRTVLPAGDLFC